VRKLLSKATESMHSKTLSRPHEDIEANYVNNPAFTFLFTILDGSERLWYLVVTMNSLEKKEIILGKLARLDFLDVIRAVASLVVVLQHACEKIWPEFSDFSHNCFNLGKFGVVSFFLVSGFIIPVSLERGGTVARFWVSRFFRLYPLYWVSLLTALILYCTGVYHDPDSFGLKVWQSFLVNITMLQGFLGYPDVFGVYATLTLELLFYMICTILFLFRRTNAYTNAWFALGLEVLAAIFLPLLLHIRVPMAALFYLSTMFFGTAVYWYHTGKLKGRQVVQLLLALAPVSFVGIYINYVLIPKESLGDHQSLLAVTSAWIGGYCFFFLAFAFREQQFPRALSWLGRISYSLYLMHAVPLFVVPFIAPHLQPFIVLFAIVSLAIGLASLTYQLIELPSINFGRYLQNKMRKDVENLT
jgi:peptidoglycan/LPS O-acetylase OafA/YrhL